MLEQTFKNIDDTLHKDAGCSDVYDVLAFVGCQKYLYE
jgi:hypothetical protein